MTSIKPTWIAWFLAACGGGCGVAAAYLTGGRVAALGAAGTACMGAAGVLGWSNRAR